MEIFTEGYEEGVCYVCLFEQRGRGHAKWNWTCLRKYWNYPERILLESWRKSREDAPDAQPMEQQKAIKQS